ncbi:MAG: hypothetical protein ACRC7N_21355 [Clostridium sp.]
MSYYSDALNKARVNNGFSRDEILLKVELALKKRPTINGLITLENITKSLDGDKIPTVLEASTLADAVGIEFSSLFNLNNKPGRMR